MIVNYWKKKGIKDKAINVISCGGNALSVIYELANNESIALIQEPMIMDNANTQHRVTYNDGEFEGTFEEYRKFLVCRGLDAED